MIKIQTLAGYRLVYHDWYENSVVTKHCYAFSPGGEQLKREKWKCTWLHLCVFRVSSHPCFRFFYFFLISWLKHHYSKTKCSSLVFEKWTVPQRDVHIYIYPQCCRSGDWTTNSTFSIHSLPQEHHLLVVAEAADSLLLLLTSLKFPWNQLLVFFAMQPVTSALKTFSSHKPFLKFRCPCVCLRPNQALGAIGCQLWLRSACRVPILIIIKHEAG